MMRREWLRRALRTFVQAALAYAAANAAGIIGEGEGATRNALAALTVASVAAGLAAIMNLRPAAQIAAPDESAPELSVGGDGGSAQTEAGQAPGISPESAAGDDFGDPSGFGTKGGAKGE